MIGGSSSSEGTVEICLGGFWGSVCGQASYWGPQEAAVVCRQLGFHSDGEIMTYTVTSDIKLTCICYVQLQEHVLSSIPTILALVKGQYWFVLPTALEMRQVYLTATLGQHLEVVTTTVNTVTLTSMLELAVQVEVFGT